MSWQLVMLEGVEPRPWLNGGGLTRELLVWPAPEQWSVRLSVAEVARDGPFSQLPGVRRWFAVLSGRGVRLRTGGGTHELRQHSPVFSFDGGATTDCELIAGATRDFNLMLRKGAARVERVHGAWSGRCPAVTMLAVYANEAPARVACGNTTLAVPPNALAWRILDADEWVELSGTDALRMEIEP